MTPSPIREKPSVEYSRSPSGVAFRTACLAPAAAAADADGSKDPGSKSSTPEHRPDGHVENAGHIAVQMRPAMPCQPPADPSDRVPRFLGPHAAEGELCLRLRVGVLGRVLLEVDPSIDGAPDRGHGSSHPPRRPAALEAGIGQGCRIDLRAQPGTDGMRAEIVDSSEAALQCLGANFTWEEEHYVVAVRVPGPVERAFLPRLAAIMSRAGDEPVGLESLAVGDCDGTAVGWFWPCELVLHCRNRISWIVDQRAELLASGLDRWRRQHESFTPRTSIRSNTASAIACRPSIGRSGRGERTCPAPSRRSGWHRTGAGRP